MNKLFFIIVPLALGCNFSAKEPYGHSYSDSLSFDKRLYRPLKISYIINFDFLKKDSLRTGSDPYNIGKVYSDSARQYELLILAIEETVKLDSALIKDMNWRLKELTGISKLNRFSKINTHELSGLWTKVNKNSMEYWLFEGGNGKKYELTIRIILTQLKGTISKSCFENMIKSIRVEPI